VVFLFSFVGQQGLWQESMLDILVHMKSLIRFFFRTGVFLGLTSPQFVFAHEVYVLDQAEISRAITQGPLNLFAVAQSERNQFFTWMFIILAVVFVVLGVSFIRSLGKKLNPIFIKIKPYADHILQITLGVAVLAAAHHGVLFGPELPLQDLFQGHALFARLTLYITGSCILFGVYPRIGALGIIALYFLSYFGFGGVYMLSYAIYAGIALMIVLFGAGYSTIKYVPTFSDTWTNFLYELHKRKYFILRVIFAGSLAFAAIYAKFLHGSLALTVVSKYNLTDYFPFDPAFIVLGAFMIEMLIGVFYLIGFELRFTSIVLLVFLGLSLNFFNEILWPHYIIIGTAIAMFFHGYDDYAIERLLYKKDGMEPVL
jgi:hypothetical protein